MWFCTCVYVKQGQENSFISVLFKNNNEISRNKLESVCVNKKRKKERNTHQVYFWLVAIFSISHYGLLC